jgi:exodeoxyribonuclease VII small subunit
MSQPRPRRATKTANAAPIISFEDAFAQMQAVIVQLEAGDIPLEDAIAAFEKGVRLAQHCNVLLDEAQLRVQTIEMSAEGMLTVSDIEIVTE